MMFMFVVSYIQMHSGQLPHTTISFLNKCMENIIKRCREEYCQKIKCPLYSVYSVLMLIVMCSLLVCCCVVYDLCPKIGLRKLAVVLVIIQQYHTSHKLNNERKDDNNIIIMWVEWATKNMKRSCVSEVRFLSCERPQWKWEKAKQEWKEKKVSLLELLVFHVPSGQA